VRERLRVKARGTQKPKPKPGHWQRLFDWQAERITLAIIALVLHEQRKRQRRHHVTYPSLPLSLTLTPSSSSVALCLLASFCAMQLLAKKRTTVIVVVVVAGVSQNMAQTLNPLLPLLAPVLGSQSVIEVIYCHQCCTLFLLNNCTKFRLLVAVLPIQLFCSQVRPLSKCDSWKNLII